MRIGSSVAGILMGAIVVGWGLVPAAAFDRDGQSSGPFGNQYQSPQSSYAPQQSQYGAQPSGYPQTDRTRNEYYGGNQYSYGAQKYNYGGQQYSYGTQPTDRGHWVYPGQEGYPQQSAAPRLVSPNDDERPRRHRRHHWVRDDDEDYRPRKGRRVHAVIGPAGVFGAGGGGYTGGIGMMGACVRTCDGYFFPIGLVTAQSSVTGQQALCKALCPAAATQLYFVPAGADGIATAYSADGHPYSKMPTALKYTKSVVPGCACHAGNDGQARLVSLMKDFTMRRGDAVMTVNGVLVFNGAYRWPYRLSDFQILDKAKYYLSNALALASLEKASNGVQDRVKRPGGGGGDEDPANVKFDAFITDLNGKTVRLVGGMASYAPTRPNETGASAAAVAH